MCSSRRYLELEEILNSLARRSAAPCRKCLGRGLNGGVARRLSWRAGVRATSSFGGGIRDIQKCGRGRLMPCSVDVVMNFDGRR